LQAAWNKYGEAAFVFSILEECNRDLTEVREQYYIDMIKPKYNMITDVRKRLGLIPRAKIAAAARLRSESLTHCPNGHPYDAVNTYIGRRSKHICRTCNAERVAIILANQSENEKLTRLKRNNDRYYQNRARYRLKQLEYSSARRDEKREYDRLHRAQAATRRRRSRELETMEQREHRLKLKRESYYRNKKEA